MILDKHVQVCNPFSHLQDTVEHCQAGRLRFFQKAWLNITSDQWILESIQGVKIEFVTKPVQLNPPSELKVSSSEGSIVNTEINKLLQKGVIEPCYPEAEQFISKIFLRPKKDGTFRVILNLKELNKFVVYHHFKMDSIHTALHLMKKGCFMASIDLQDAYYTIPVFPEHRRYLKFSWQGKMYQYTCLPNGLASAPRIFTKIMKPVYSVLRCKGHISFGYIDDSYLQDDTFDGCRANVTDTTSMFEGLGFIPHPTKSVTHPVQELVLLGFLLNSKEMTISLTTERANKLIAACNNLLTSKSVSIQEVAHVVGLMVASFPAVTFAPLFYRALERDKTQALKLSQGDFSACMTLSEDALTDLHWWVDNINKISKPIHNNPPDILIQSDASKLGWGAYYEGQHAGGPWSETEAAAHINVLETTAAFLALQSFCSAIVNKHVRLELDNTTAVAYVNNMGGNQSSECNTIVRHMWLWCIQKNIWLSATHIPGATNTEADRMSRQLHEHTEWALNDQVFDRICDQIFKPDIDLFASRLNNKLERYVSWKPDPGAIAIDAFSINWATERFYAFPPFSLLTKVLQKVGEDVAEGILIMPMWSTQPWYSVAMQMLIDHPRILPQMHQLLYLKHKVDKVHPLQQKLKLLACHLSGDHSRVKAFQNKLPTSSLNHGERGPSSSTKHTSTSGQFSVVKGKFIHFLPL